jgi:hypothetical protein
MAKCKVLNRPDYELTLTSEEKEALQKLLGKVRSSMYDTMGINEDQRDYNNALYHVINEA